MDKSSTYSFVMLTGMLTLPERNLVCNVANVDGPDALLQILDYSATAAVGKQIKDLTHGKVANGPSS